MPGRFPVESRFPRSVRPALAPPFPKQSRPSPDQGGLPALQDDRPRATIRRYAPTRLLQPCNEHSAGCAASPSERETPWAHGRRPTRPRRGARVFRPERAWDLPTNRTGRLAGTAIAFHLSDAGPSDHRLSTASPRSLLSSRPNLPHRCASPVQMGLDRAHRHIQDLGDLSHR